ncbi:MAG: DUF2318 domain-containing protein [Thermoanaerobaculia bacterium]|nr:MAG: DUF2318 domain-containing protein [Thermoanaerobaculia bacterium]MBZ0102838.1 DUF2318 domain-containing protein [Thermoanaerobaculia bacterium]
MKRFRPLHGILLVLLLMGAVLGAERLMSKNRNRYQRVGPDPQGRVVLPVGDLAPLEVRWFRFLNAGNQEVRFFVGRDGGGALQVAFDASENDFKLKRGFRADGAWIVNNKCETSVRLAEINQRPSGCAPVPIPFRAQGSDLVLTENDLLAGWRYFR